MIRIREAVVVEGRYDKNTLAQIVDAPILRPPALAFLRISSCWLCCARWRKSGD